VSRVSLQVYWFVISTGRGADDIENTASSTIAFWAVVTELLPGNALIKSVTVYKTFRQSFRDYQYARTHTSSKIKFSIIRII
jgi:hypothetical protein